MIVRELLVSLGFDYNETKAKQAEKDIENIKSGFKGIESDSAQAANAASQNFDRISRKARQSKVSVDLGVNYNKAKADMAERDIKDIKDGFKNVEINSTRAANTANRNFDRMSRKARQSESEIARIGDTLESWGNRLNALAAVAGVGFSIGSLIRMVDEWKVIRGQVQLVTASQKEATETQKELYAIAGRTRQEYSATAGLFTSIARNANELGKSNQDILAFTEDVANAMLIGGGSQASQQAALVQLGQALGSGTLRGDELNSIMEQAPRLAKVIADGMGTTIGQLRTMGAEGKLTAIDIFNAIRSQSDRLKMEMGAIPWTVDQATTKMMNSLGRLFNQIESKTGIVSTIAEGFAAIADYIDEIDVDKLIFGFKMLTIYATAFFVANKWGAIITGGQMLIGILRSVRNSYLAATGQAVAFKWAGAGAAATSILAFGKILLIAGAIAFVVLAIQDFIGWINGADSVFGRTFGKWEDVVNKFKEIWDSVTSAINEFLNTRIIDSIKDLIGWIGEALKSLAGLDGPVANLRETISDKVSGGFDFLKDNLNKMTSLGYNPDGTQKQVSYSDGRNYDIHQTFNINGNAPVQEVGAAAATALTPENNRDYFNADSVSYEAG